MTAEWPSLAPFDVAGKFSIAVEHDGHGQLFIFPVADLRSPEGCEAILRVLMACVNIDPATLEHPRA